LVFAPNRWRRGTKRYATRRIRNIANGIPHSSRTGTGEDARFVPSLNGFATLENAKLAMRLRSAENEGVFFFLGGSTIEHLHVAVAAVAAPVVLEDVREGTKLSTSHPSVIQSFRLSDKYEHNNCCFPPSPLILLPKMVVVVTVVFFPHESVLSYLGTGGRKAKGGGMKGEQMWSVREASESQDECRRGG